MLRILADENMPGLHVFNKLGEVTTAAGRSVCQQDLTETDIILVRSVTKVNASLLAGTPVKFVGSATIGTDHVDLSWLKQHNIGFAHAPGCNAQAVTEYVLQVALRWCLKTGRSPSNTSLGIVGVGNVGSRLLHQANALGFEVLACDPPKQRQQETKSPVFVSLEAALHCDVVSLHVPLTRHGEDCTFHLLDKARIHQLHDEQLLINTCRGPVIDNNALLARLQMANSPDVVLDVWEGEPSIMPALFHKVWLGTPHIAGYSLEGKLRGSWMLYQAVNRWLGKEEAMPVLPAAGDSAQDINNWQDVLTLLASLYAIEEDAKRLAQSLEEANPALAFDALRKNYPLRHEVSALNLTAEVAAEMRQITRLLQAG